MMKRKQQIYGLFSIKSLGTLSIALIVFGLVATGCENGNNPQNPIRIALFETDATPEIGVPMAYNPVKRIEMPLSAKGIVLVGNEDPIVLLAVDWIGIYNEPNEMWRRTLAEAAGTTPERVSIHTLHQHDAPRADFTTGEILAEYGRLEGTGFDDREFVERSIERTADALRDALENGLQTVTHVGTGTAIIEKVASNRRVVGRDGTVPWRRNSSTSNVEAKRKPVGTIDPELMMLSFWNGQEPLALLSYYATHPQSYYRTGGANPDFPGIAREKREEDTGIPHIHFDGAGGNVAAGKWNRGWTEKRMILADRVATGMAGALDNTVRTPVDAGQLEWRVESVILPPRVNLDEQELVNILEDDGADNHERAARELAFLRRHKAGINLTALRVGPARVMHTPGELAIEYQLMARSYYPDDFVANASYTYMSAGYISTEIQYEQGSYEALDRSSRVAPEVEQVLLSGFRRVLDFEAFRPDSARLAETGYRLERSALQWGYDGEYSWVNGRAGVIPARYSINPIGKPSIVMTAHEVEHSGPDVFEGLHYFRSRDLGLNWAGPFEESVFERETVDEEAGLDRLVTDFTPKFHHGTETMLGIGHSAIYNENRLLHGQPRTIAYAVFDEQSQRWQEWQTFELPEGVPGGSSAAASGRRVDLEDGSILFPVYAGDSDEKQFQLAVIRSDFDGSTLTYRDHGNTLRVDGGTDIHEPSLTEHSGRFYLAFQNDDGVFVSRSSDGLQFDEPEPLHFDNGRPLGGNSAHLWVSHNDRLYLAYTRQERDRIYLAQVETEELQILAQTEGSIIPAGRGGRLGNLDLVEISNEETWILATEWNEPTGVGAQYAYDDLIRIARLKWLRPD